MVGETFLATLSGLPTSTSTTASANASTTASASAVRASVTHTGGGLYQAAYTSPRLGSYNLTVAKVTDRH